MERLRRVKAREPEWLLIKQSQWSHYIDMFNYINKNAVGVAVAQEWHASLLPSGLSCGRILESLNVFFLQPSVELRIVQEEEEAKK